MKIGIIALSLNKTAVPGYYNSQELGLGKALAAAGHFVTVYKLLSKSILPVPKTEMLSNMLHYTQLPASSLGINGFFDKDFLDTSMDVLICFCDTQLYTTSVGSWCHRHNIAFYPYIGVINSASTHAMYKHIMNILTRRLIRFYRKQTVVFAKTPSIAKQLQALGVSTTQLAPIGLDTTLLKQNYAQYDRSALKKKWGYAPSDRILLFIGRLVPEKEPLEMISIFADAYQKDTRLRLCIIGKGELQQKAETLCHDLKLMNIIKILPSVPNKQIWEFYRISDYLINLNHHEIYGMTIMEAMYYECPIIAYHAPGPDYIIGELAKNPSVPAYLANTRDEIITQISKSLPFKDLCTMQLHDRIITKFIWEQMIERLLPQA